MAWRIKDEHLDMAEGMHRIIYENPEVLTRDGVPQTHEVSIFLKLDHCPYCGHVPEKDAQGTIDVHKTSKEMQERLNQHHEQLVQHRRKYGVKTITQSNAGRGR